jgi:hypothetical protein
MPFRYRELHPNLALTDYNNLIFPKGLVRVTCSFDGAPEPEA